MTLISQKTRRLDIVERLRAVPALADDADGTAHVVAYFEPDPQGVSPFCCVSSAGANHRLPLDPSNTTPMRFVIGFWARRDQGQNEAAENLIDDLALELSRVLGNSYLAEYVDYPTSDYETISGIPYKFELHFVEIKE